MSGTVCPACRKPTTFEASTEEMGMIPYKYNLIRCSLCKTAIGVTGMYNTDTQLIQLREAVRAIADKLGVRVKLPHD
jgi:hypothetical protein